MDDKPAQALRIYHSCQCTRICQIRSETCLVSWLLAEVSRLCLFPPRSSSRHGCQPSRPSPRAKGTNITSGVEPVIQPGGLGLSFVHGSLPRINDTPCRSIPHTFLFPFLAPNLTLRPYPQRADDCVYICRFKTPPTLMRTIACAYKAKYPPLPFTIDKCSLSI